MNAEPINQTAGDESDASSIEHVNQQARRGISVMMVRQVALQIITFLGGIILARVLTPGLFGLFATAQFLVSIIAQFGDFGLAPSLIQRKQTLQERDLQVAFTIQQTLTFAVALVLWFSAPLMVHLYATAPPETVWLVRALALNVFLMSWRAMGALQLERQMQFNRLAWIEVTEILLYITLSVGLALAHCGVWSLVWATLARALLGTLLVYRAAPWPLKLVYDPRLARELLRFGLPFQAGAIISSLGSALTPTLVAHRIGMQAVGYLNFASANGNKPLVLVDNIVRVSFPHFSRLQHDPQEVNRILARYLNYLVMPALLWFTLISVGASFVVPLIYTIKWMPAITALHCYAASVALHVIVWMLGTALTGTGRVAVNARLVTGRTICQFAMGIPMVIWLGFNGIAVTALIVEGVSIPLFARALGPDVLRRVVLPLTWLTVPTLLGLACGEAAALLPLPLPLHVLMSLSAATLGYGFGVWRCAPQWMREAMRQRGANVMARLPVSRNQRKPK